MRKIKDEKCIQNVGHKHVGKIPLEINMRRWEDNITMNLRYCGNMWTGFIWHRIWTSGWLL
jgi:hypothetical protein